MLTLGYFTDEAKNSNIKGPTNDGDLALVRRTFTMNHREDQRTIHMTVK
jgi:hypothetical protein